MNIPEKHISLSLKVKLVQNALGHLDEFDSRTGVQLLRHEVLRDPGAVREDDYAMQVLTEQNHEHRVAICPGPLLAYRNKGDKASISIIEVTDLLLDRDIRARKGALEHFLRVIQSVNHVKPERLGSVFLQHKEALVSEELETWSKSAVILFDAVSDDFFLNLAGLQQCLSLGFNEGTKDYLPRVFKPKLSSIEWIELPFANPSSQHSEIRALIKQTVSEANTFSEACNAYYQKLGGLPLAPSLSFSALLAEWNSLKGDVVNLWRELWSWADTIYSPVARYHVCQLFCKNTKLVPEGEFGRFWDEVSDVISRLKPSSVKSKWEQEWAIRLQLAQHYLKYFEVLRPERNSEPIAQFACWLAEKVSTCFAREWIEGIRSNPLKHYLNNSTLEWQTINPRMQPSTLQFTALHIDSMWSLSLLCQLGDALRDLKFQDLESEKKAILEVAIAGSLSVCFPLSMLPNESPTYSFEIGIGSTARVLGGVLNTSAQQSDFNALMSNRELIQTNEQILLQLKKIVDLQKPEQSLIMFALRTQSHLNAISTDELWKIVSDEKWFKKTFLALDLILLQFLLDSLSALVLVGGEIWRCNFPHIVAIAAEEAHGDLERQKTLFLYTILSCAGGDTVSAIERLKKGARRLDFAEQGTFLKDQFSKIAQFSQPWVSARIRPIIGSLSVI